MSAFELLTKKLICLSSKIVESPAFMEHVPVLSSTRQLSYDCPCYISGNRLEVTLNTYENVLFSQIWVEPIRYLAAGWVGPFDASFPSQSEALWQRPLLAVCLYGHTTRAVRSMGVTTVQACCVLGLSPGEHLWRRQGLAQVPLLSNKSEIQGQPCSLNVAKTASQIPQYILPSENPIRTVCEGWMLTAISRAQLDCWDSQSLMCQNPVLLLA